MRHIKFHQNIKNYISRGDFFVNIGANDGIINDPLYDFIEPYDLAGLAVEPVKATFDVLKKNYSAFSKVTCVNAAIYATPSPPPFFRMADALLEIVPSANQSSSINKEEIRKWMDFHRQRGYHKDVEGLISEELFWNALNSDIDSLIVQDESIQFMTFNELVKKYDVKKIDILSIDIEGSDFDVFQSIDLERFKPKFMVIENRSFSETQNKLFKEKLNRLGYRYIQNFQSFAVVYAK